MEIKIKFDKYKHMIKNRKLLVYFFKDDNFYLDQIKNNGPFFFCASY